MTANSDVRDNADVSADPAADLAADQPADAHSGGDARDGDGPRRRGHSEGYDHLAPLLTRFAGLGRDDPQRRPLRDELAEALWPVVVNIARRYRNRGEPLADLEQAGAVGLLLALERFDPARGENFLSFAVPTITGEVRRHFRDRTWSMRVPRRLKDLQRPVREAAAQLSGVLERAPRPSEIAAHLGIDTAEVIETLGAQQAYAANSLDELVGFDDGSVALGDLLGDTDPRLATATYRGELRAALTELSQRERTIVALRFFGDLTQSQIAAKIGVSQMQVSRLLSRTLATLRERLDT